MCSCVCSESLTDRLLLSAYQLQGLPSNHCRNRVLWFRPVATSPKSRLVVAAPVARAPQLYNNGVSHQLLVLLENLQSHTWALLEPLIIGPHPLTVEPDAFHVDTDSIRHTALSPNGQGHPSNNPLRVSAAVDYSMQSGVESAGRVVDALELSRISALIYSPPPLGVDISIAPASASAKLHRVCRFRSSSLVAIPEHALPSQSYFVQVATSTK